MEMKSLIEWTKYAVIAGPLVGASATVILYAEDVRKSIGDIRKEQVEIRKTQGKIIADMDTRFDKIEAGHDRIVSEVNSATRPLGFELGRLVGRSEAEQ